MGPLLIGILFPNVTSAAEAEEYIRNCYYPSATGTSGTRGYGYGGCNQDGTAAPWLPYMLLCHASQPSLL